MWARGVCSTTRSPLRASHELKKHLHRLYQRVHPDRFAQHPVARDVNQRSFQALQAALAMHFPDPRTSSDKAAFASSTPHKSQSETLEFFAHADARGDELRRAQVQLRPGANALAEALVQLFKQLGLDPPPPAVLRATPAFKWRPQFTSLGMLARHARMHAIKHAATRQKMAADAVADAAGKAGDAQVLLLALQRAHGVRIIVHAALPRDTRLAGILARVRDALRDASRGEKGPGALRGAVLELDPGGVASVLSEGESDVLLGACARRAQWDAVIRDEELVERCERRRMCERKTRKLEEEAARGIGVRLVMHHLPAEERVQAMYRTVLRALAMDGDEMGVEEETGIAVMVVPGDEITCDERAGVLRVGLERGAAGVRAAVDALASMLGKAHARIVADEGMRERERAAIVRALRLGGIRRADGVSDLQWTECLNAMRERATRLRGLLDGASVQVVDGEAGVAEDGEIRIPWDFARHMQV